MEPIRDLAGLIGELSGQCDTSEHARVMSGSGGREPSGSYTHNETHSITDPVGLYVTTSSQRVRVLSGSGSREPSGSHTPDETHVTDGKWAITITIISYYIFWLILVFCYPSLHSFLVQF